MTIATASLTRMTGVAFDRRISPRLAILVLSALACVLYAIWRHEVPAGPLPSDTSADTMCLISRIGLGGFCR
jgi:hypothetical protein